jgi:lysophospholipase L1-like esterase
MMRSVKSCWSGIAGILLCSLLLISACSDSQPRLPVLPDEATLLAFGDSLTFGTGAAPAESWPAVLARLTGRKVINAGIPGEVSASGKSRLPGLLDAHHPDLLILCHGGNDLLRKFNPQATRANLGAMIASAIKRNIPVLLVGVPRPGLVLLESAELYDRLAQQYGLAYEGDILPAVESDNSLKSDHVHPNAAGYRKIAGALLRQLQASGALPRDS